MRLILAVVAASTAMLFARGAIAQEPQHAEAGATTAQRVLSPDGKLALTLAGDTLLVWDTATGRLIRSLHMRSAVASFSFSPDASRIVVIGKDNRRWIWDAVTGRLIHDE
jgi:WD40 repeat protein